MKKLLAVLGLAEFTFSSNFWNGENKHVKMNEAQLQQIEEALEKTGTEEDAKTIETLQGQISGFEATETAVQEAISAAMELNGMEFEKGTSVAEAITALGAKCKEYGDSKATHTFPKTDGKEKPDESTEPEYGFEKVLNDNSKYTKLT